jgi:hypothetical protein
MDLEATADTARVDEAFHELLLTLDAETPPLPRRQSLTPHRRGGTLGK